MGETAVWLGVLAIVAVVGALALMWRRRGRKGAIARRMQSTEGILDEIGVRKVRGSDGKHFWAVFGRYSYEVDGRQYTGNRITRDASPHESEAEAVAALRGRKAGQAVTVWYDPEAPGAACLDGRSASKA